MKLNLEKALKNNKYIIYPITGTSMYPLLKEGDRVKLEISDEYNLFDIVLFKRKRNTYVLHRIINIKDNTYAIIGDNANHIDYLKKEDLIAKLTGIYINNKLLDIKDINQNIPYKKEETINSLINDSSNFFLERLKEAYYELIKLATLGKYNENKLTILTQRELIELCHFLDEKKALHLLGFAIDKFNLKIIEDISKPVLTHYQSTLARNTKIDYVSLEVQKAFSKNKIKHIFLKGCEIKKIYKYPFLRSSNDIDIYVDKNDFENAKKVLLNELPCEPFIGDAKRNYHDESFIYKKINIKIELHFSISSYLPDDIKVLLDNPFKNATQDKNDKYRFHLNKDNEMLYFFVHTAKHIRLGQFWYSTIVDYFYMNKNVGNRIISQARLNIFSTCFNNYINHIYNSAPLNKKEYAFENILFINENLLSTIIYSRKQKKYKHIIKRIFVPYSKLKKKYKSLEKYPILFPLFSIYRWIKLPFKISKEGRQELQSIKKQNDFILNQLKECGLEEYVNII